MSLRKKKTKPFRKPREQTPAPDSSVTARASGSSLWVRPMFLTNDTSGTLNARALASHGLLQRPDLWVDGRRLPRTDSCVPAPWARVPWTCQGFAGVKVSSSISLEADRRQVKGEPSRPVFTWTVHGPAVAGGSSCRQTACVARGLGRLWAAVPPDGGALSGEHAWGRR